MKREIKRIVHAVVSIILIVGITSGCAFNKTPKVDGVTIKIDIQDDVPEAVLDFAKERVQLSIEGFNKIGANPQESSKSYTIIDAKITGLTQIITGTVGNDTSIDMYLLEYRLLPDEPDHVIVAGGMALEDGWITEADSTGQPYLILFCDQRGTETTWQRVCITNTDVILMDYGTPEMLTKYGNEYTAATMELYTLYLEQNNDK